MGRDQIETALRKEDRLRLSSEWQEQFAMFDTNDWRQQVCHLLQLEALRMASIEEHDLNPALVTLRSSRANFQWDPDFYKPVYVRFDRAVPRLGVSQGTSGEWQSVVGGAAMDVPLLDPWTLAPTTIVEALEARFGTERAPVVVLAGSIT